MGKYRGKTKNEDIQSISSSLKFISKLKPGEKVFVSSQSIYPDTYWNSVFRNIQGEGREKTYQFIQDKINDAMDVLNNYPLSNNESDIKICKNLIIDLINLNPSFESLKVTYINDQKYISNIESVSQDLNINIKEVCTRFNFDYIELTEEAKQIYVTSSITNTIDKNEIKEDKNQDKMKESVCKSPKSPRQSLNKKGLTLTESGNLNLGSVNGLKTDSKKKKINLSNKNPKLNDSKDSDYDNTNNDTGNNSNTNSDITDITTTDKDENNGTDMINTTESIETNETIITNNPNNKDKIEKTQSSVSGKKMDDNTVDLMTRIRQKQKGKTEKSYHQYDSFYRSSPEDIKNYQPDWKNGLGNK